MALSGASFFFTVRLRDARSDLLVAQIGLLRDAVRACRQRSPFVVGPSIVLPNRLHTIWTLPPGDNAYGKRWKMIKDTFARHVPAATTTPRKRRADPGIWQRRFWECPIETPEDFALYSGLIRDAAVTEKLVKHPEDWPYSSHHKVAETPCAWTIPTVRTTGRVPSAPNP